MIQIEATSKITTDTTTVIKLLKCVKYKYGIFLKTFCYFLTLLVECPVIL